MSICSVLYEESTKKQTEALRRTRDQMKCPFGTPPDTEAWGEIQRLSNEAKSLQTLAFRLREDAQANR